MAIVLALGAAAFYGAGDFVGGMGARRNATLLVALGAQVSGLLVLVSVLPFLAPATIASTDLMAGAAAGVFGGLGLAIVLRTLAVGPMSIVAPTTALSASAVPVIAGLVTGERPGSGSLVGIAISFGAIALITREPAGLESTAPALARRSVMAALAGGAIFGLFFVCLHQASPAAGLWPLLPARITSIAVLGGLIALRRIPMAGGAGLMLTVLASGALDMTANVLYLLASHQGMLTVVAALTGLYPASTVLLAQTRLRERLAPIQMTGLGVAVIAAVLVAA